jgi:hypothetical protein
MKEDLIGLFPTVDYRLKMIREKWNRQVVRDKKIRAIAYRKEGYTLRNIAEILGYKSKTSIVKLLGPDHE